jgi:hypothetical protein
VSQGHINFPREIPLMGAGDQNQLNFAEDSFHLHIVVNVYKIKFLTNLKSQLTLEKVL